MKLFSHANRERTPETRRVYARFELLHTLVDFSAALCFTVGSVMFFYPAWETPAVWFFTVGSLFFMAKPTLRLVREVKLYRMGKLDRLASRAEDE